MSLFVGFIVVFTKSTLFSTMNPTMNPTMDTLILSEHWTVAYKHVIVSLVSKVPTHCTTPLSGRNAQRKNLQNISISYVPNIKITLFNFFSDIEINMRHCIGLFSLVVLCFSLYFLSANVEAKSTYGSSRIMRRGFKSSLLSTARGFGKRSDDS